MPFLPQAFERFVGYVYARGNGSFDDVEGYLDFFADRRRSQRHLRRLAVRRHLEEGEYAL